MESLNEIYKNTKTLSADIKALTDANVLEFIIKYISKDITQEDIDSHVTFDVVSAYGGMIVGELQADEIKDMLSDCERELNRDFYLIKQA